MASDFKKSKPKLDAAVQPANPTRAKGVIIIGGPNAQGNQLKAAGAPWSSIVTHPISGANIWVDSQPYVVSGVALSGAWQTYNAGINSTGTGSPQPYWGPEAALLYDMIHGDGHDIYCVKLAVDPSSHIASPGQFNDWQPSTNELYNVLMNQVQRAATALPNGVNFEEVFIVQGEADSTTWGAWAYAGATETLVDQLRTDLNAGMKIVHAELHNELIPTLFPADHVVRAGILSGAAADPLMSTASVSGFLVGFNQINYAASGYIDLGHALYDARL